MNLIRRSKKSTEVTANAESPLNEIGDVSAVADRHAAAVIGFPVRRQPDKDVAVGRCRKSGVFRKCEP